MSSELDKEYYALFDEHYARIRAFIRSIVREEWIAEDLTQEAFIRAFRKRHTLKNQKYLKPWLFRIAKNLCTDHFRQGKKAEKKKDARIDPSLIPSPSVQECTLEQKEMAVCVRNHFQLLPENLRTVLWLFDVDGFTHKEIAEILDIDIANVKVRLHRARKKMKEILDEHCSFERDDRNVFICVPSDDPGRSH